MANIPRNSPRFLLVKRFVSLDFFSWWTANDNIWRHPGHGHFLVYKIKFPLRNSRCFFKQFLSYIEYFLCVFIETACLWRWKNQRWNIKARNSQRVFMYYALSDHKNLSSFQSLVAVPFLTLLTPTAISNWTNILTQVTRTNRQLITLKGQYHQIFHLWFFSSNNFSWPQ